MVIQMYNYNMDLFIPINCNSNLTKIYIQDNMDIKYEYKVYRVLLHAWNTV